MRTPTHSLIIALAAVVMVAACSTDAGPPTTEESPHLSEVTQTPPTQPGAAEREPTPEELIVEYDKVAARWGDSADPNLASQVAAAFLAKGAVLEDLSRADEAVTEYDEVVTRWSDTADPNLASQVATAFLAKGAVLEILGRADEAVTQYDEVATRWSDTADPNLASQVATAF
ncbi:MAG: tetratricopeptide repeat protein, partial [Actinomycetota bacterium]|nr:tetratricopeptide repeat protein [Actinomycetota bacterium]